MNSKVMLDTSFLIRLMNHTDSLHKNAKDYYKYFLEKDYELVVSTIAIGEYSVGDSYSNLPLKNLQILPYNLDHAVKTGELAKFVFNNKGSLSLLNRNIIPNDTKLFAQTDLESDIKYYISSDSESKKVYDLLKQNEIINFDFVDINVPYDSTFGVLNFKS